MGRLMGLTSRLPPTPKASIEPVAQPVEHVTFNHGVVGSNPTGLANKIRDLNHVSGVALVLVSTSGFIGASRMV